MEISSRDINLLVDFCQKNGINATKTDEMISTAFGDNTIGLRQVQKIAKEYRESNRDNFERKEGSGRPCSVKRNSLTAAIENEINENSDITLRELANKFDTSYKMMHNIVTSDVGFISKAC